MSDLVVEQNGTVTIVRPTGRLDLQAAPRLRQDLDAFVQRGQGRLVLDLGEVPFIDSSGLGAIVSGLRAARQAGGDLRIARANEPVRLLLKVTRLDSILRPYETVQDAADGF